MRGLTIFNMDDTMIIYNRKLEAKDFNALDEREELIYYKNNNIAYTINKIVDNNNYIIREKKIFNNQLVNEQLCKTIAQIEKKVL